MNVLGDVMSLLTLLGVALVMNINNSVAVGMLTLRARSNRHGFRMRLGGLLASLVVRLALVMVLAASLRPEFPYYVKSLFIDGQLQPASA